MNVVVTGGAGFVGSHVVEYYAKQGHTVTALDNLSRAQLLKRGALQLDNAALVGSWPGVTFLKMDVRDFDALAPVIAEADVVIHAAGQTAVTVSVDDPIEDFSVNATGTLNVLEAARRSPRKPAVVFCSTNKVYGSRVNAAGAELDASGRYAFPENLKNGIPEDFGVDLCTHSPYGCSKLTADLYAQDYAKLFGMKIGVFRMSCIYGTRQFGVEDQGWVAWFVIAALFDQPITIFGDGKQVRDVLHVGDLVRAFDAFVTGNTQFGVFNTGGGAGFTMSLHELLGFIDQHAGVRPPVKYAGWRPGDQKVYVSDVSKIHAALGWQPRIAPSEGIRELVEWVRANAAPLRAQIVG